MTAAPRLRPIATALAALLLGACSQAPTTAVVPEPPASEPVAAVAPPVEPPASGDPTARVRRATGRSPLRAFHAVFLPALADARPRDRIEIRFSAPIDPATFDPAADVTLEPHVELDWRWRDPMTLEATTRTRLLAPSSAALTLGPDIADVHGRTLAVPVELQLERPVPTVLTTSLTMSPTTDASLTPHDAQRPTLAPDDVRFVLPLDQADPDLDALARRLALTSTERRWEGVDQPLTHAQCFPESARAERAVTCVTEVRRTSLSTAPLASALEPVDCGSDFRASSCVSLRATEAPPPGAVVTVMLDGEPLRGVVSDEVLEVAVAEPLEVVSIHCPDVAVCHEASGLEVTFNAPLAVAADGSPEVVITVDGVEVDAGTMSHGAAWVAFFWPATPGPRAVISVERATGVDGAALAGRVERKLTVGERPNELELERDLLTIDRRSPHLLVGEALDPAAIEADLARVEPERLAPLLAWLDGPRDTSMAKLVTLERVALVASDYRQVELGLPLHDLVAEGDAGIVAFRVRGDDAPDHHGVVVFTSIGLTVHAADNTTLVMATDLASGAASQGVEVSLVDAAGEVLHSARTDAGGLVALPARSALGLDVRTPLWTVATHPSSPDDVAVARVPRPPPLDTRRALAGVVRSDRTIYVPGQAVRLVGQLRSWSPDGPDALGDIALEIAARRWLSREPVASAPIDPDDIAADGTLNTTLSLPLSTPPGDLEIVVQARDREAHPDELVTRVWVATLGRDAVDLDVVADAPRAVAGEPLGVTVTARGLDGTPLASREVSLSYEAVEASVRWPSCTPCELEQPAFPSQSGGSRQLWLDEAGRARVELSGHTGALESLTDIDIVAALTLDDGRAVEARTRVTIDPSPFYLHLERSAGMVSVGDRLDVGVCAVGVDGRAWLDEDVRAGIALELEAPSGAVTPVGCDDDPGREHCIRCAVELAGDEGSWTVRTWHTRAPAAIVSTGLWASRRGPGSAPSAEWTDIDAPDDLSGEVQVRFVQPEARRALATVGEHRIERWFALDVDPKRVARLSWTPQLVDVPSSTLVLSTLTERTDWELDVDGLDAARPTASEDTEVVWIPTTSFELDVGLAAPTTWSSAEPLPVRIEVRDAAGVPVPDARVSLWVVDAELERQGRDARHEFHDSTLRTSTSGRIQAADSRDTLAQRIGFTQPHHGGHGIGHGGGGVRVRKGRHHTPQWFPERLDTPPHAPLAWAPALTTDDQGVATHAVEVPRDVRRLVVRALVADDRVGFGEARAEIAVPGQGGLSVDAPLSLTPHDRAEVVVTPLDPTRAFDLGHADGQTRVEGAPVALEMTARSLSLTADDARVRLPTRATAEVVLAAVPGLEVTRHIETIDGAPLDADVVAVSPGQVVRVTLTVEVDRAVHAGAVRIIDRMPGGLEVVDGRWSATHVPAPGVTAGEVTTGPDRVELWVSPAATRATVTVHAMATHAGWYAAPALEVFDAVGAPLGALDGHWTVSIER